MWWDTYTVNILPLLEQKEVDEENTTSANLVCILIFLWKLPMQTE